MNAVVEFREHSIEIPNERKSAALIVLQAPKLLDEVELELRGDPGRELKGNVAVSERAPVPP
jgi:hypothetical protein